MRTGSRCGRIRAAVKEVISQDTARTMMALLRAVTAHGTGAAAAQLNHPLGGKTGTTSDFTDAWFMGFSPSVTCGVWVGFDSRESLGSKETGAKAALPIWMAFMKQAIAGKDDEKFLMDADQGPPLLEAKSDSTEDGFATGPKPAIPRTGAAGEGRDVAGGIFPQCRACKCRACRREAAAGSRAAGLRGRSGDCCETGDSSQHYPKPCCQAGLLPFYAARDGPSWQP